MKQFKEKILIIALVSIPISIIGIIVSSLNLSTMFILIFLILLLLSVIILCVSVTNSQTNNIEEKQNKSVYQQRQRFTLSSGRYIGGIDIPCGVYKLIIVTGDCVISFIGSSESEEERIYLDRNNNIFPSTYNGLEIAEDSIIKINGVGRIEFIFIRENTRKIINEQSRNEVQNIRTQNTYDSMDGWQFENFCANILKSNGFIKVDVTKGSGDQGVDIIAEKDGIKYAIQCKNYSQPVGNKAIQEVNTGKQFYKCHVAVVMTNNYFTKSAKELAKKTDVILWDGDYLKNHLKVEIERNSDFQIKRSDDMYDKEKGIYPSGEYLIGRDIPVGGYVFTARNGKDGIVALYENYKKRKDDDEYIYQSFDLDFHLALMEEGEYLVVENADIQKV